MSVRLKLARVDLFINECEDRCCARVVLQLGSVDFLGQFEGLKSESQATIAQATFDSVNQALIAFTGEALELQLLGVDQIQPIFLDQGQNLFVVTAGILRSGRHTKVVGVVVAEQDLYKQAVAAAALDALNRQIAYLLMQH
ncbi:MAG: hypothetical protein AB1489_20785 [Acidobacteriota bacterium]